MPVITSEVVYLLLILGLLVIPRALQRLRIPAPLTSVTFGMVAAVFLIGFSQDATLALLATLGISSLFLFAGLEVRMEELKRGMWPLLSHLLARAVTLTTTAFLAINYLDLSWQVSALLALALLTPSTGFILDTLSRLGLTDDERYWVTVKAVGGELLALVVLFVVLQSGSLERLSLASGALALMIVGMPLLFMGLGRLVLPHAPGSEFSLLVMVGLIAACITYQLGVYYLVGAFLAGVIARLLRQRMPLLASDENLRAIQNGGSVATAHRFDLAAPAHDRRRNRDGQPACGHGADADTDIHAGSGHHLARAVPGFGCFVRGLAHLRRCLDPAAVSGACQGTGL